MIVRNENGSWNEGTLFKNKTTGAPVGPHILHKRNLENSVWDPKMLSRARDNFQNDTLDISNSSNSLVEKSQMSEVRQKQILITSFNEINQSVSEKKSDNKRKLEFAPEEPKTQRIEKKRKKIDFDETHDDVYTYLDKMRTNCDNLDRSLNKPKIAEKTLQKKKINRKSVRVTFNFQMLKETNFEDDDEEEDISIIGQINDCWTLNCRGNFIVLNPYRLQEVQIFKRLMQNYVFSTSKTSNIIDIYESYSWNSEFNELVEDLMGENREITDQRIISNGIKVIESNGKPIISEISPDVNFLGLSDLQEILKVIKANAKSTLEQTRPLKIRSYFKTKAVQMAKQLPNPDKESMKNLIQTLKSLEDDVCIHSQPLLHKLKSINE